jgi:hypothetical protein
MPIESSNKIMVYQDNFSKSKVFEIQSEGLVGLSSTPTYLVTKVNGKSAAIQHIDRSTAENDKSSGKMLTDSKAGSNSSNDFHHRDTVSNIPILLVEDDKDILQSYIF